MHLNYKIHAKTLLYIFSKNLYINNIHMFPRGNFQVSPNSERKVDYQHLYSYLRCIMGIGQSRGQI